MAVTNFTIFLGLVLANIDTSLVFQWGAPQDTIDFLSANASKCVLNLQSMTPEELGAMKVLDRTVFLDFNQSSAWDPNSNLVARVVKEQNRLSMTFKLYERTWCNQTAIDNFGFAEDDSPSTYDLFHLCQSDESGNKFQVVSTDGERSDLIKDSQTLDHHNRIIGFYTKGDYLDPKTLFENTKSTQCSSAKYCIGHKESQVNSTNILVRNCSHCIFCNENYTVGIKCQWCWLGEKNSMDYVRFVLSHPSLLPYYMVLAVGNLIITIIIKGSDIYSNPLKHCITLAQAIITMCFISYCNYLLFLTETGFPGGSCRLFLAWFHFLQPNIVLSMVHQDYYEKFSRTEKVAIPLVVFLGLSSLVVGFQYLTIDPTSASCVSIDLRFTQWWSLSISVILVHTTIVICYTTLVRAKFSSDRDEFFDKLEKDYSLMCKVVIGSFALQAMDAANYLMDFNNALAELAKMDVRDLLNQELVPIDIEAGRPTIRTEEDIVLPSPPIKLTRSRSLDKNFKLELKPMECVIEIPVERRAKNIVKSAELLNEAKLNTI